jgi:hypothetical protein
VHAKQQQASTQQRQCCLLNIDQLLTTLEALTELGKHCIDAEGALHGSISGSRAAEQQLVRQLQQLLSAHSNQQLGRLWWPARRMHTFVVQNNCSCQHSWQQSRVSSIQLSQQADVAAAACKGQSTLHVSSSRLHISMPPITQQAIHSMSSQHHQHHSRNSLSAQQWRSQQQQQLGCLAVKQSSG